MRERTSFELLFNSAQEAILELLLHVTYFTDKRRKSDLSKEDFDNLIFAQRRARYKERKVVFKAAELRQKAKEYERRKIPNKNSRVAFKHLLITEDALVRQTALTERVDDLINDVEKLLQKSETVSTEAH